MANPAVVPQSVAIIMDGNGRWAQKRGLPRMAGHRAGAVAVDRITEAAAKLGVRARAGLLAHEEVRRLRSDGKPPGSW